MTEGRCPACGASVQFTAGSAQVVVCSHCQTVVARADGRFEARGTVATLVNTGSPLRLGLSGRYRSVPFTVVGHLQKDHGRGPWDEWFLQLENGAWAWLTEAEGTLRVLFPVGVQPNLRSVALEPRRRFELEGASFAVEESGRSRLVAAEGELPNELTEEAPYVDASGQDGAFASLELTGEGWDAYVGKEVRLEQLGFPPEELAPRVKKVALLQARCTQCNGPLELKAPDRTRRVACPYCGALLDVSQGKLSFLEALAKPPHEPRIPLGRKGTLDDVEWTCLGMLVRSCEVEGVRYPWQEYLLFNRERGFTWLLESNGHWTHLKPIAAGDVVVVPHRYALHLGMRYRCFQSVEAVTDYVLGEFYWEVTRGERAHATEYVYPPYSVNEDLTDTEVAYTHGEYLRPEVVKQAFRLEELPRPEGIAPAQPNPHLSAGWRWAGAYALGILLLFGLSAVRAPNQVVLDERIQVAQAARSASPEAMHFSAPFEIIQAGNVGVRVESGPMTNDWLGVEGDLVNEDTGEVVSFYAEMSRYSGVDSEGSWSEGSLRDEQYLSRVPPGRYVLRTTAHFPTATAGGRTFRVQLVSGVPRPFWVLVAVAALLAWPALIAVRRSMFESQRWGESNLS